MNFLNYTFFALGKDLLWTPIWWYTGGIRYMYGWLTRRIVATWRMLGLWLWIKNLFTPMFQQYDMSGRLISFFVRLAQIIARFVAFIVLDVVYSLAFLVWCVAPLALIYYIIILLAR